MVLGSDKPFDKRAFNRLSNKGVSTVAMLSGAMPIAIAFFLRQGGKNLLGDCRFQAAFGFPAPSCGLTRSFVALVRGDFGGAVAYHLFGPVIFAIMAMCAVQGLTELMLQRPVPLGYRWVQSQPKQLAVGLALLAIGFIAYYGIRLYARYNLIASHFDNALMHGFVSGAHLL